LYIHCINFIYLSDEWTPYASYLAFEIAEYIDPRHCVSTEQPETTRTDNWSRSNSDSVESSDVNDDHNNKLWVRIIFNDEVQSPTKIISEMGPVPSFSYSEDQSSSSTSPSSVWIPFTTFVSYLKSFSISTDEYQSVCPEPLSGYSAASVQMQEEIRATTGFVNKK